MTDELGAAGNGVTRRELLAASGGLGVGVLAGCIDRTDGGAMGTETATPPDEKASVPAAAAPQTVHLDAQDGAVTVRTRTARLPAHPGESMGGPAERSVTGESDRGRPTTSVPTSTHCA